MKVKLTKIKIKDFKGIKSFETDFKNKNLIEGENGLGKTTILDAIYFCLFSKDSTGLKKFKWEPLNADNNIVDTFHLEIELTFDTDGVTNVFRKETIKSKAKRVDAVKEFSVVTNLYVNEEIMETNKEFAEKTDELLGTEEMFFMGSSVYYLLSQVDWKDARNLVTKTLGNVGNEEIFNTMVTKNNYPKPEVISALKEILIKKDADKIKSQCTIEVDSAQNDLNVNVGKVSVLEELIKDNVDSQEKSHEALKVESDNIQTQLISYQNDVNHNKTIDKSISEMEIRCSALKIEISNANVADPHIKTKSEIERKQQELKDIDLQLASLTTKWNSLNTNTSETNICPTCSQQFPQEIIDKALKNIEDQKEQVKSQGQKLKQDKTDVANAISTLTVKLSEPVETIDTTAKNKELGQLTADIEKASKEKKVISDVTNLLQRKEGITKIISQSTAVSDYKTRLELLNTTNAELETKIKKNQFIKDVVKDFQITKYETITKQINDNFSNIKLKLFETLKNGSVKEVFTVTTGGVDYKSLNTAGKISAGIEMCNVMQKTNDTSLPIIIDNKESINAIPSVDTQVICCAVSKEPELKIKKGGE